MNVTDIIEQAESRQPLLNDVKSYTHDPQILSHRASDSRVGSPTKASPGKIPTLQGLNDGSLRLLLLN